MTVYLRIYMVFWKIYKLDKVKVNGCAEHLTGKNSPTSGQWGDKMYQNSKQIDLSASYMGMVLSSFMKNKTIAEPVNREKY